MPVARSTSSRPAIAAGIALVAAIPLLLAAVLGDRNPDGDGAPAPSPAPSASPVLTPATAPRDPPATVPAVSSSRVATHLRPAALRPTVGG